MALANANSIYASIDVARGAHGACADRGARDGTRAKHDTSSGDATLGITDIGAVHDRACRFARDCRTCNSQQYAERETGDCVRRRKTTKLHERLLIFGDYKTHGVPWLAAIRTVVPVVRRMASGVHLKPRARIPVPRSQRGCRATETIR